MLFLPMHSACVNAQVVLFSERSAAPADGGPQFLVDALHVLLHVRLLLERIRTPRALKRADGFMHHANMPRKPVLKRELRRTARTSEVTDFLMDRTHMLVHVSLLAEACAAQSAAKRPLQSVSAALVRTQARRVAEAFAACTAARAYQCRPRTLAPGVQDVIQRH